LSFCPCFYHCIFVLVLTIVFLSLFLSLYFCPCFYHCIKQGQKYNGKNKDNNTTIKTKTKIQW
jgi:hypothetical protein